MKSNYLKGLIFAFAEVLCFSILETMGILSFASGASSATIVTFRFLVATILFGFTILVWKRSLFKIDKKDLGWLALTGAFLTLETICYWNGLKALTSVALFLTLAYLSPLWTAIMLKVVKKDRFNWSIYLSIALAIAGVALSSGLIPGGFGAINLVGVSYAIGSGLIWSLYFIFSQKMNSKYHPFTILFYVFAFVTVSFLVIQNPMVTISQLNPHLVLILAGMAIVNTYLAYLLLNLAIHFNKALKSSILDTLVMPISIGLSFIVLHQTITLLQGIGAALILSITYLLKYGKNLRAKNE